MAAPRPVPAAVEPVTPAADGPLTYRQVFERIGAALDPSWLVIPDTFLGIHSAANLPIKGRDGFLCGAVWASIGHSVAAAVGRRSARPAARWSSAATAASTRPPSAVHHGPLRTGGRGRDRQRYLRLRAVPARRRLPQRSRHPAEAVRRPQPLGKLRQGFANGLGVQAAQSITTAAALDQALATAKASNAPALIVTKVNSRDLPRGTRPRARVVAGPRIARCSSRGTLVDGRSSGGCRPGGRAQGPAIRRRANTANPHLLINQQTAMETGLVSKGPLTDSFRGQAATLEWLRVQRQLDEALAVRPDPAPPCGPSSVLDPKTAVRLAEAPAP